MKLALTTLISLVLTISSAFAQDEIENLQSKLATILPPNMVVDSIEPTPMEGVYIATVHGQDMFVYSAGDYLMVGDVYDTVKMVNLGEERAAARMAEALDNIPESEMIFMGEPMDRYVTVFTDTDCFYCQKFHLTVPELQANGIQVRYLMFPRAGLQSDSYREAVSVWCAADQAAAMTTAKAGGRVDPAQCENPVADQYKLGQQIGVRGTPTMILDTGKVIPGFLTPEQLMAEAGM